MGPRVCCLAAKLPSIGKSLFKTGISAIIRRAVEFPPPMAARVLTTPNSAPGTVVFYQHWLQTMPLALLVMSRTLAEVSVRSPQRVSTAWIPARVALIVNKVALCCVNESV